MLLMSFQLVSMDWKLGVAMSSSSCRSLNSPYVSLQLRIAESGGNIRLQTVEMTIPEFQVSRSFSLSLSLSLPPSLSQCKLDNKQIPASREC